MVESLTYVSRFLAGVINETGRSVGKRAPPASVPGAFRPANVRPATGFLSFNQAAAPETEQGRPVEPGIVPIQCFMRGAVEYDQFACDLICRYMAFTSARGACRSADPVMNTTGTFSGIFATYSFGETQSGSTGRKTGAQNRRPR